MVWSERWNCLENGRWCPFTCGSCILYCGREGALYVEGMTITSGGTGEVVLAFKSDCVWKV